jgi:hypothetical protein
MCKWKGKVLIWDSAALQTHTLAYQPVSQRFVFIDLRLQLLDVENNPYLIKALYGLLMLLPQSQAFQLLSHRLRCVPNPELMRTV